MMSSRPSAEPSPLDRVLSPRTGWTRDHWVEVFGGLTGAFARSVPSGGSPARPELPGAKGDLQVVGLEGFARMSVAWGAWLGQPANPMTVWDRGARVDVAELMARGLRDGTTKAGPSWWGSIGDRDQRIVEAAELATGLWLGADRLVPLLGGDGLAAVLAWLGQVHGRDTYPDNWVLFPAFVATVQRGFGLDVRDAAIDTGIDAMADRYRGDGWYADGPGSPFDQYTGWAVHWHLLLWAEIDGHRRPALRRLVRARARTYLEGIVPTFAANGTRPLFGRSLGYRFAAAAPFALAEIVGLDAVRPGLARRIASGTIARHLADGALDPASGWLRRGVAAERPDVCERYVSAGASAWAAHVFIALGLAPDHPFWRDREEALPAEVGDGRLALRGPGFVLGWRRSTGETWLLNGRSGHPADIPGHDYTPYYGKLAYRSHFPMTVRTTRDGGPGPDGAILVESTEGSNHRAETRASSVGPDWLWSRYAVEIGRRRHGLTTAILPWRDVEVRLTRVRPGGPVRLVEAPAALPATGADAVLRRSSTDAGWELASASDRTVAIRSLAGYDEHTPSGPHGRGPDLNLVAGHAEQPTVRERRMSSRVRTVASVVGAWAERRTTPRRGLLDVAIGESVDGVQDVRLGGEERAAVHLDRSALKGVTVDGWHVSGDRLRVVRVAADGTAFAGESIVAIDGAIRLARSGPLTLRKIGGPFVEATVETGFELDPAWAGTELGCVSTRDPAGPWRTVGRLASSGVVPIALVRRLRRESGRRLIELRLEP